MSFFGSSSDKYSGEEKPLSEQKIRAIISRHKVRSLDADEETLAEEVVEKARRGDGKISLRQIDEALKQLMNRNKISRNDREGIMKQFVEHFEKQ